jgi:hypothetical protein
MTMVVVTSSMIAGPLIVAPAPSFVAVVDRRLHRLPSALKIALRWPFSASSGWRRADGQLRRLRACRPGRRPSTFDVHDLDRLCRSE